FAGGTWDRPDRHRPDLRRETEPVTEFAQEPGLRGAVEGRSRLDAQDQVIAALGVAVQHDLIFVVESGLAEKDLLDLARIEVDALEDDHVVGAAVETV